MRKLKIKFKKIEGGLKKIPGIMSEHTLLTLLGLLLISLILSGLIFYKYVILTESSLLVTGEDFFRFDQNTYQKVLSEWELRNKKNSEIDLEKHLNPFKNATSTK